VSKRTKIFEQLINESAYGQKCARLVKILSKCTPEADSFEVMIEAAKAVVNHTSIVEHFKTKGFE
jgi:hypothetical protein